VNAAAAAAVQSVDGQEHAHGTSSNDRTTQSRTNDSDKADAALSPGPSMSNVQPLLPPGRGAAMGGVTVTGDGDGDGASPVTAGPAAAPTSPRLLGGAAAGASGLDGGASGSSAANSSVNGVAPPGRTNTCISMASSVSVRGPSMDAPRIPDPRNGGGVSGGGGATASMAAAARRNVVW
jgi:hypothetical protein